MPRPPPCTYIIPPVRIKTVKFLTGRQYQVPVPSESTSNARSLMLHCSPTSPKVPHVLQRRISKTLATTNFVCADEDLVKTRVHLSQGDPGIFNSHLYTVFILRNTVCHYLNVLESLSSPCILPKSGIQFVLIPKVLENILL